VSCPPPEEELPDDTDEYTVGVVGGTIGMYVLVMVQVSSLPAIVTLPLESQYPLKTDE
jgi:hypothetical protein